MGTLCDVMLYCITFLASFASILLCGISSRTAQEQPTPSVVLAILAVYDTKGWVLVSVNAWLVTLTLTYECVLRSHHEAVLQCHRRRDAPQTVSRLAQIEAGTCILCVAAAVTPTALKVVYSATDSIVDTQSCSGVKQAVSGSVSWLKNFRADLRDNIRVVKEQKGRAGTPKVYGILVSSRHSLLAFSPPLANQPGISRLLWRARWLCGTTCKIHHVHLVAVSVV